jgi:hypothetical protein
MPLDIRWSIPDDTGTYQLQDPVWPRDWAEPQLGTDVVLKNGRSLKVTAIDYFPEGEEGGLPFIYVVLRNHQIMRSGAPCQSCDCGRGSR